MLDTARSIATPEGIELTLRLAGPAPRAVAWVFDFFLRLIVLLVMYLFLIPLGGLGMGLWLIAWFLLEWLFPAACEVWFDGATPGKKIMGLQVVHDDGTPTGLDRRTDTQLAARGRFPSGVVWHGPGFDADQPRQQTFG